MEETKNDIIKKYSYKDYIIYIKETKDSYEYYLQNEEYGIISLMYGISKEEHTLEDLMVILNDNIDIDIKIYQSEYED